MILQPETSHPRQPDKKAATPAVTAVLLAVGTFLLSGCGHPPNADPPPGPGPSNAAPAEAVVELSSNQLSSIKIGPVGTYLFPVEKEAAGSISFEEDPAIVQAESTLMGAAATFAVNSNELARARVLYDTNGVSQRELEQATADAQTAGAALQAARDALRALGRTDAEMDSMIAAGRIGSGPDAPNPTQWVLANVLESDSPLIQVGQPVKVKVMAFPDRTLEGKVSRIYATVDPNLHRLAVRCEVDDPKDELRPGMLANIAIQVSEPVESIAIPASGVVREGDGTMTAWVTTDRRHFTQRIIETGMRAEGQVEILNGLQHGELVVTDGAIFLDNMLQAPVDD
jgi:membrane fusion protein, heavy metal efflux system